MWHGKGAASSEEKEEAGSGRSTVVVLLRFEAVNTGLAVAESLSTRPLT